MKLIAGSAAAFMIAYILIGKGGRLTKAKITVEKIIYFLIECKSKIAYSQETIGKITQSYAESENKLAPEFIIYCCENMKEYDFPKAWEKAVIEHTDEIGKKDKSNLLLLGKTLGTSDRNSQLGMLEYMINEFEISHEEKKEKEKNEKRLYCVTGISAALLVLILII